MGGLVKLVSGKSGKKAAKKQAAATMEAARLEAASDRENARAAQLTTETMIAQNKAAEDARTLLSTPQDQIDLDLASTPAAEVDPVTGRKRSARSSFMSSKSPGSGIKIP